MSNHFTIKNSPGKGKGLFALSDFEKGQILLKFDGKYIEKKDVENNVPSNQVAANYLQVSKDLYLDLSEDHSYFINHSCNPNCYIKTAINNAFLIALIPIKAGQELFYDYSLTSNEDESTWQMNCGCGAYACRKNITGFSSLSKEKQESLIKSNLVPKYIIQD